ncbi:MAG: hypothetical protein V4819_24205 [Verrucomicrobiota bacterium]
MKQKPLLFSAVSSSLLALGATQPQARAASGDWTATTGSPASWGTATNWSTDPTVPGSAAGDVINISSNITGAYTINLDGIRTMGTLLVGDADSTHGFTLATGTGGVLTLDGTGATTALVRFGVAGSTAGISNTISAPITLVDNARFYTTLTAAQNLNGNISGAAQSVTFDNDDGVTAAGPVSNQGQFFVNGNNSYGGGTTIDDVRVNIQTNNTALGAAGSAVTILDGGQVYASTALSNINYAFNIAGNGWTEPFGQLGALRLEGGANVTGTVAMSANAAIGNFGGTGTISGAVSGAFDLSKVGGGHDHPLRPKYLLRQDDRQRRHALSRVSQQSGGRLREQQSRRSHHSRQWHDQPRLRWCSRHPDLHRHGGDHRPGAGLRGHNRRGDDQRQRCQPFALYQ